MIFKVKSSVFMVIRAKQFDFDVDLLKIKNNHDNPSYQTTNDSKQLHFLWFFIHLFQEFHFYWKFLSKIE